MEQVISGLEVGLNYLSTSFTAVAFIFTLYHYRKECVLLLVLLLSVLIVQLNNTCDMWSYDIIFILVTMYGIRTRFYIRTDGSFCNTCSHKKGKCNELGK